MRDAKRTLDRVVIGNRDEAHPTLATGFIHALRVGVRLAEAGTAQREVAAVRREPRVDVQIATLECHISRLGDGADGAAPISTSFTAPAPQDFRNSTG